MPIDPKVYPTASELRAIATPPGLDDGITTMDPIGGKSGQPELMETFGTDLTELQTVVSDLEDSILSRTGVKTATYAAAAGDLIPCDTAGGSFGVSLPAAPLDRTHVALAMVGWLSPNAVLISCAGTDVFDRVGGPTTKGINSPGETFVAQYDAATGVWTPTRGLDLTHLDVRYAPATGAATAHDDGAYYGNGVLSTFTHTHGLDTDWPDFIAWNTVTREPENVQCVSIDADTVQITTLDVPPIDGIHFRCSR